MSNKEKAKKLQKCKYFAFTRTELEPMFKELENENKNKTN